MGVASGSVVLTADQSGVDRALAPRVVALLLLRTNHDESRVASGAFLALLQKGKLAERRVAARLRWERDQALWVAARPPLGTVPASVCGWLPAPRPQTVWSENQEKHWHPLW